MIAGIVGAMVLVLGMAADGPRDLRVGHWVEVRGLFAADGSFVAEKVTARPPQDLNLLIGEATKGGVRDDGFVWHDQPVSVSDKTEWKKVDLDGLAAGARVKVEGRWRGPLKFSAREVAARGEGRDRLGGRIDAVTDADGGRRLRIMRFEVFMADDVEFEAEAPLAELELAPAVVVRDQASAVVDEDDLFGHGYLLREGLRVSGQAEGLSVSEDGFDLGSADRTNTELVGRLRLAWTPGENFRAVGEVRYRHLWRHDEQNGSFRLKNTKVGELYGHWRDPLGIGWDVRVGRQDFDDQREWLYDQNLDAVRLYGAAFGWPMELGLSTTLADGSPTDEAAVNSTAYLWNGNEDRHLAAWAIHRRFDLNERESRLHVGVRALGNWVSENDSWLELSAVEGRRGSTDLLGWGYDVGTTWTPDRFAPFSFTLGYALGRGGDPDSSTDRSFRQSGLQDNNAKFAGVTSFRYYGELLDPELSNLGILTAGVGVRLSRRTSLDLVWHHYRQDLVLPFLADTALGQDPDGVHANLGWEADLVFGWREWENWDLEIVTAMFHPDDAFPEGDDAYLVKLQLRRRF